VLQLCMLDRACSLQHLSGPRGDVVFELLRDPLAFLEATAARHGGAAALVLGGERVVLVSDPGLAQAVLVDQAGDFVKARRAPALRAEPLRPACGSPARERAWTSPTLRWAAACSARHYSLSMPPARTRMPVQSRPGMLARRRWQAGTPGRWRSAGRASASRAGPGFSLGRCQVLLRLS